jgi:hypothetical protein
MRQQLRERVKRKEEQNLKVLSGDQTQSQRLRHSETKLSQQLTKFWLEDGLSLWTNSH